MAKPEEYRWNAWAGALGRVIQIVVFVPMLYILLMPWLCLALVKFDLTPLIPGFFQAMASTGWLVASGAMFLFIVFSLLRGAIRSKAERARRGES